MRTFYVALSYLFTFRFRLNGPIAPYIRSFSSEVDIYKINRKVIFNLLAGEQTGESKFENKNNENMSNEQIK